MYHQRRMAYSMSVVQLCQAGWWHVTAEKQMNGKSHVCLLYSTSSTSFSHSESPFLFALGPLASCTRSALLPQLTWCHFAEHPSLRNKLNHIASIKQMCPCTLIFFFLKSHQNIFAFFAVVVFCFNVDSVSHIYLWCVFIDKPVLLIH